MAGGDVFEAIAVGLGEALLVPPGIRLLVHPPSVGYGSDAVSAGLDARWQLTVRVGDRIALQVVLLEDRVQFLRGEMLAVSLLRSSFLSYDDPGLIEQVQAVVDVVVGVCLAMHGQD